LVIVKRGNALPHGIPKVVEGGEGFVDRADVVAEGEAITPIRDLGLRLSGLGGEPSRVRGRIDVRFAVRIEQRRVQVDPGALTNAQASATRKEDKAQVLRAFPSGGEKRNAFETPSR
jgi:hypothetical protein